MGKCVITKMYVNYVGVLPFLLRF